MISIHMVGFYNNSVFDTDIPMAPIEPVTASERHNHVPEIAADILQNDLEELAEPEAKIGLLSHILANIYQLDIGDGIIQIINNKTIPWVLEQANGKPYNSHKELSSFELGILKIGNNNAIDSIRWQIILENWKDLIPDKYPNMTINTTVREGEIEEAYNISYIFVQENETLSVIKMIGEDPISKTAILEMEKSIENREPYITYGNGKITKYELTDKSRHLSGYKYNIYTRSTRPLKK